MKEIRVSGAACEVDVNDDAAVGGGVEDAYGEDRATEEQPVTPWTLTVARFVSIPTREQSVVFLLKKNRLAPQALFEWAGI